MSEPPITGGTPLRTAPLPSRADHGAEERWVLLEVLDSGRWWATQGTKVCEFERRLGDLRDSDPALAVPNGSPTIDVALVIRVGRDQTSVQDLASLSRPVTEGLAASTLWFTTAVLTGTREDALDAVAGVEKVQRHVDELARSTA